MRRRFGRGRRNQRDGESRGSIDAARCRERIAASGLVPGEALEAVAADEVPDTFAALFRAGEGGRVLVAFSPFHGGDAALAALEMANLRGHLARKGS